MLNESTTNRGRTLTENFERRFYNMCQTVMDETSDGRHHPDPQRREYLLGRGAGFELAIAYIASELSMARDTAAAQKLMDTLNAAAEMASYR